MLKTNDVRTGLKKPEQDVKQKRAATAQLADTPDAAVQSHGQNEAAGPHERQADGVAPSHVQTAKSQAPAAAAAAVADPAAASARDQWDIARAARER